MMETINIFLASSQYELNEDRTDFANFIQELDEIYNRRGKKIQLIDRNGLGTSRGNQSNGNEYVQTLKECQVFVALFHKKMAQSALEECYAALKHSTAAKAPTIIIYEKDANEKELRSELAAFKLRLDMEQKHIWGHYGNAAELRLNFVMWLQCTQFSSMSDIRVERGEILIDGITIAQLSQLPFAADNPQYQQLCDDLEELPELIDKASKRMEKIPDDENLKANYKNLYKRYYSLIAELPRYQKAMLDMAKYIEEKHGDLPTEKLQRAAGAFQSGDMQGARALLREIEIEGKQSPGQPKPSNQQMHQLIEAALMQVNTEIADVDTPLEERINRVIALYSKADDRALHSNYNKKRHEQLLFDYACFQYNWGHYQAAEQIHLRQIELSLKLNDDNTLNTATAYNNLGLIYNSQGDYDKALECHFKALEMRERVLGYEHLDTAMSYNNITLVYIKQHQYVKALNPNHKALDIRTKILNCAHPDIAMSYYNIGEIYNNPDDDNMALKYYSLALDILGKSLGTEHPDNAKVYISIGMIYNFYKNDYDKALECYSKALDIREKAFGTEHPETAKAYNHIGVFYHRKGKLDKALEYYSKAMAIMEKELGTEHPDTATSYNSMGMIYDSLGNYEKALEYLNKSLAIREKLKGAEHPDNATAFNSIGVIYYHQGEYDKALRYFNKALDICNEQYHISDILNWIESAKAAMK